MLSVSFTNRAKEYGYIVWPKKLDEEFRNLLGEIEEVQLFFKGTYIGKKRVDWKSRRISIGYKHTRYLTDDHSEFQLHFEFPNKLMAKLI